MTSLLRRLATGVLGVPFASTAAGCARPSASSAAAAAVNNHRWRLFHSGVPASHVIVDGHVGHGHSHGPNEPFVPKIRRDGGEHLGVGRSTAVIAIGSNQGDSVELFRQALKALKGAGIEVERHSSLYETSPAYVTDQPKFLNAAAVVRVSDPEMAKDPLLLLDALKTIEKDMGRVEGGQRFVYWYTQNTRHYKIGFWNTPFKCNFYFALRHGPRPIDLDIIFHERGVHRCERLEVPHPRYQERGFVLAPLADLFTGAGISGGDSFNVASGLQTALRVWNGMGGEGLVNWMGGDDTIRRVMPLRDELWSWGDRTMIMGILNATPDSFSDGGKLSVGVESGGGGGGGGDAAIDLAKVVAEAKRMVAEGADFIDVGGQSTRPGATRVSAQEEAARVLPVVKALSQSLPPHAYISVDTFYGAVAAAAADAGADIINDVSAGTLDPDHMYQAVADMRRPLPYLAMHMRGDPTNMQSEENTTYGDDVAGVVGIELRDRARLAAAAGVEPWRMWTDPGLGFAKTHDGCWDLLGNLGGVRGSLTRSGAGCLARAPMVLGASRKGFLGGVTGRESPGDRDPATAAACVAGVLGGADIMRVHNVAAVVDALKVGDAVWRHRARAAAVAYMEQRRKYAWLVKDAE